VCDDGLVVDLSMMKTIRVDPAHRTARADPGLLLAEFDRETQAFGLATPMGTFSITGIAGLTLGGGLGWLMSKHGLACDNLVSIDLVTADGGLVTASARENDDLFWGVRGGSGNFGVVTSFEYQLHPLGPVLAGLVAYPISQAPQVLRFFREYGASCPDELGLMADSARRQHRRGDRRLLQRRSGRRRSGSPAAALIRFTGGGSLPPHAVHRGTENVGLVGSAATAALLEIELHA